MKKEPINACDIHDGKCDFTSLSRQPRNDKLCDKTVHQNTDASNQENDRHISETFINEIAASKIRWRKKHDGDGNER